uniref:Uncharacterized protein n=1 Tax=Zooxanthella nutricula TaxID=1333877 RepID=A0A7S2MIK2_9DINO
MPAPRAAPFLLAAWLAAVLAPCGSCARFRLRADGSSTPPKKGKANSKAKNTGDSEDQAEDRDMATLTSEAGWFTNANFSNWWAYSPTKGMPTCFSGPAGEVESGEVHAIARKCFAAAAYEKARYDKVFQDVWGEDLTELGSLSKDWFGSHPNGTEAEMIQDVGEAWASGVLEEEDKERHLWWDVFQEPELPSGQKHIDPVRYRSGEGRLYGYHYSKHAKGAKGAKDAKDAGDVDAGEVFGGRARGMRAPHYTVRFIGRAAYYKVDCTRLCSIFSGKQHEKRSVTCPLAEQGTYWAWRQGTPRCQFVEVGKIWSLLTEKEDMEDESSAAVNCLDMISNHSHSFLKRIKCEMKA